MKILVINAGSSSIKYALFKFPSKKCLLKGSVEKIGEKQSYHYYQVKNKPLEKQKLKLENPTQAFKIIIEMLKKIKLSLSQLDAMAHRVVHGGEYFQQPTIINPKTLEQLRKLIPLAPLHNPANILGIEMAIKLAPTLKQVAVFDTAFHYSLPPYIARYPIPDNWYKQHNIRRYGFHGISHFYVAKQAAKRLNKPLKKLNLISLHLGNGASACAIQQGVSIDTSMGFTPQEGLMMGTRGGDLDSSIYPYLTEKTHLSINDINRILNHESGLKAIAGSNDMRDIHQLIKKGDKKAKLAFEMYCYRIKKYIGAYYAILGQVDALIFTGGIGENDAKLRDKCCYHLEHLNISIHPKKNQTISSENRSIHHNHYKTAVLVIKTDEELEIASQTVEFLSLNGKNRREY